MKIASSALHLFFWLLVVTVPLACVDPEDTLLRGTNDILVVDGTITNLAEAQVIKLNRSTADRLTGRFGNLPVTKATVEVVVDSLQVIPCHETVDGSYQLPSDFKGQVGHAYQLRFTLSDGTSYQSSTQVMPAVPAVGKTYAQFSVTSLPQETAFNGYYRAGHNVYLDVQDPASQHNYYRWDWALYEKQRYCRSCAQGVYAVNNILPHQYYGGAYVSGNQIYEDCFVPTQTSDDQQPAIHKEYWVYDYFCRTDCWEIIRNTNLNLFDDLYSNGGLIEKRLIAQIPFYDYEPCLVDIRQSALTADAYRYFKLLADQSQRTGGLADTPPTAPIGNVHNTANKRQAIVGYFTASAVALVHHWLDRKDTDGIAYGATDPEGPHTNVGDDLFYALNSRRPTVEPTPPYTGDRQEPKILIWGGPPRVPTAICVSSDGRTPFKPDGWRDL